MERSPIFEVTTTMEKEDYRNFLYLTTFQKPDVILGPAIFSFFLGLTVALGSGFSFASFLFSAFGFFLVFFCLMSFKLENMVRKSYPLDRPCAFSKEQTIRFFDTFLASTNRLSQGNLEVSYQSVYKGVENQNYIILYLEKELASVIRKRDLEPDVRAALSHFLSEKIPNYVK